MDRINPDQVINFQHLKQFTGDDANLTAEIFGLFRHQTEMWARALDPLASDDAWQAAAHTLKGSARAVGANGLAEVCEHAETLVGDNSRTAAREHAVDHIQAWIKAVLERIQRWEYHQSISELRAV